MTNLRPVFIRVKGTIINLHNFVAIEKFKRCLPDKSLYFGVRIFMRTSGDQTLEKEHISKDEVARDNLFDSIEKAIDLAGLVVRA